MPITNKWINTYLEHYYNELACNEDDNKRNYLLSDQLCPIGVEEPTVEEPTTEEFIEDYLHGEPTPGESVPDRLYLDANNK